MYKRVISIVFTVLFLGIISAPLIISAVDNSVDISFFYGFAEEEQEKDNNNNIIDVFFSELNSRESGISSIQTQGNLEYFFKNYPNPHFNLILPPPEYFML